MPTSLFQYEMLPTTWFYLSSLPIFAVFGRFNRILSARACLRRDGLCVSRVSLASRFWRVSVSAPCLRRVPPSTTSHDAEHELHGTRLFLYRGFGVYDS